MAFWKRRKPVQSDEAVLAVSSTPGPVLVEVDRDSVSAGDDVESHSFRIHVDSGEPIGQTLERVLAGGYLPTLPGGKATWIVEACRPLAVLAQQEKEPRWLVARDRATIGLLDAARPELRFAYWAQAEPAALRGLVDGSPIPPRTGLAVPACDCSSHEEFFGESAERLAGGAFLKVRDEGWQALLRCRPCWQAWLLERHSAQDRDVRPASLRKLAPCVCEQAATKEGPDADAYLERHLVHAEPKHGTGDDLYRCLRTDLKWRRRTGPSRGGPTFIRKAAEVPCRCAHLTTLEGPEAAAYLEGHLAWHSMTAMASERRYRCRETGTIWLLDFEPSKPWDTARRSLHKLAAPPA